jgi:hypothetical protein
MRVLEQQLPVDEQLAEEDARPEAQPEDVQRRDAEPDRRPDRRDGCGVPQRLPELRRAEVQRRERDDAEEMADRGSSEGDPRRVRSELSWS